MVSKLNERESLRLLSVQVLLLLGMCCKLSFAANMIYTGGDNALKQHPEVYLILYGNVTYNGHGYASYITDGTMANFYRQILNSTYIDWLSEYNIQNQTIKRGSFMGTYKLNVTMTGTDSDKPRLDTNYLKDAINNGNIPHSKYAIYMIHYPGTVYDYNFGYFIQCAHWGGVSTDYGGFNYGSVPECPAFRLPGNQDMMWSGIAFVVFTLLMLLIWPLLSCSARVNCYRWNDKLWCGPIAITGKTLMHIFFWSSSVTCLFTGAFITVIAYFEYSINDFWTGIAIICVGGGLILLWISVYIITTCCIRSLRLNEDDPESDPKVWCFKSDCCGITLWKFNLMIGIIISISAILAIVLICASIVPNVQVSASHEIIEIITTGWSVQIDNSMFRKYSQLCDQCQIHWNPFVGTDGVTYYVQKCWSNLHGKCISSP